VRQHPTRACQFVDERTSRDHLVRGQRILVPVAAGDSADDRHDGVAVAEEFLDVVRPVQELGGVLHRFGFATEPKKERLDPLAGDGVVVPLLAHVDVMGLDVEDELVLGPAFLKCLGVFDFVGFDLIAIAEDLVQGQERRSHPAAAPEEVAPGTPLPLGDSLGDAGEPAFVLLLLGRLWRRHELFIGGDPRRDRRQEVVFGVEITLPDPHECTPSQDRNPKSEILDIRTGNLVTGYTLPLNRQMRFRRSLVSRTRLSVPPPDRRLCGRVLMRLSAECDRAYETYVQHSRCQFTH
jgi:hypothetical protein